MHVSHQRPRKAHSCEGHALPWTGEEEDQRVQCIDDITGEELPWSAVRQARDQEVKYLPDLVVYEKVDERDAIARSQVTPGDTNWIDPDTAHEEGAHSNQVTTRGTRVEV